MSLNERMRKVREGQMCTCGHHREQHEQISDFVHQCSECKCDFYEWIQQVETIDIMREEISIADQTYQSRGTGRANNPNQSTWAY